MKRIAIVLGIGLVMCGWGLAAAQGAVQVSPLFSDHMVLQRGMQTPIWGKASPGEKITVELAKQSAGAAADEKGDWLVKLPAMKVGDATTLTITGTDGKPITIKDVVIGDVWDASGQSNMDWQVKQSAKAQEEIKSANHPNIRFFRFPKSSRVEPTKEIKPEGKWEVCTPQTVGEFSGVAYFFAREISGSENVPVGIIQNAWGGMPAEAFTSEQTLLADPELAAHVEKKRKAVKETDAKEKYEKELAAWQDKNYVKDPGNKGVEKGWAKSEFDDGAWKTMKLPAKWEPATGQRIDGALWFRRSVEIPGEWEGKDVTLRLGLVDDFDVTYFNGEQVGAIGKENKLAWAADRKYTVPGKLVKAGRATVAVRVFDQWGDGGFNEPADNLSLSLAGGAGSATKKIPLAGEWKYEIEYAVKTPEPMPWPPAAPFSPTAPNAASNLFNGMINPVIPYAIKGAIWYQGESNAGRAKEYQKLFPMMIADWRKQWTSASSVEPGQGDFPFLFVQLANFGNWKPRPSEPSDSGWAELREAQTMTLAKSPNTGMAVTIDIGDSGDIHPKNKQDVGKRLALCAQKLVYGKAVECFGPMYESMSVEGDKVRIKFSHADGLKADGEPKGFQIAGEDKKWVWAQAKIDGQDVVVWSKSVAKPVVVRYGWQDDPVVNLYNGAGLPASPFRTDP